MHKNANIAGKLKKVGQHMAKSWPKSWSKAAICRLVSFFSASLRTNSWKEKYQCRQDTFNTRQPRENWQRPYPLRHTAQRAERLRPIAVVTELKYASFSSVVRSALNAGSPSIFGIARRSFFTSSVKLRPPHFLFLSSSCFRYLVERLLTRICSYWLLFSRIKILVVHSRIWVSATTQMK